jgi:hypothetical protein
VKADIVFASESAGVGKRAGSDKATEVSARFEFGSETGQKLVHRSLLHEANERFERAEVERVRRIGGESGSEAEVAGYPGADGGNKHSATDISEKLTARFW